jgi:hypothetical protein
VSTDRSGAREVPNQNYSPPVRRDRNRRVIDVSCTVHGGPRGFTPLVCSKHGDHIELDPHATGQCVIILDEKAATELFDALGEWLG